MGGGGGHHLLFEVLILQPFFNWIFWNLLYFLFGYDHYASARMVASQLNRNIISLLKRPLTHYWSTPLIHGYAYR